MAKQPGKVEPFKGVVQAVVALLVAGEYEELQRMTSGKRLTSTDIAAAVHAYGRRLVDLPLDALDELDVVEIKNAVPSAWSVRVNLWSAEEGRSDLTLELTVKRATRGYNVEVDDLHVL